jgi:hypothetical protein
MARHWIKHSDNFTVPLAFFFFLSSSSVLLFFASAFPSWSFCFLIFRLVLPQFHEFDTLTCCISKCILTHWRSHTVCITRMGGSAHYRHNTTNQLRRTPTPDLGSKQWTLPVTLCGWCGWRIKAAYFRCEFLVSPKCERWASVVCVSYQTHIRSPFGKIVSERWPLLAWDTFFHTPDNDTPGTFWGKGLVIVVICPSVNSKWALFAWRLMV